jgi:hypothetical protein
MEQERISEIVVPNYCKLNIVIVNEFVCIVQNCFHQGDMFEEIPESQTNESDSKQRNKQISRFQSCKDCLPKLTALLPYLNKEEIYAIRQSCTSEDGKDNIVR